MIRQTDKLHESSPDFGDNCIVPVGAPDWVTVELLKKTLSVWQRYYPEQLTAEDALGMILGVSHLFDALARVNRDETIRCTGPGQQS